MHQDAIPFEQSPRTFVITVFALIIIVYIALLFGKYAIPQFARRIIALWVSQMKEVRETVVEDESGEGLQPRKGLDLRKVLQDEEQVMPNKSLGSSALCGRPAI
jgi:hypothetical protein